jgi:hypothetical protein
MIVLCREDLGEKKGGWWIRNVVNSNGPTLENFMIYEGSTLQHTSMSDVSVLLEGHLGQCTRRYRERMASFHF